MPHLASVEPGLQGIKKGLKPRRGIFSEIMPTEIPVPQRSGVPKVMGILLIIFASIYLMGSIMGALAAVFGQTFIDMLPTILKASPEVQKSGINVEMLVGQLKGIYRIQGAEKLATAAISGFGLFAGIKLTAYTAQGLRLAIWWAISALTYLVLEIWLFAIYINPLITKFLRTFTEQVKPLVEKDADSLDALMKFAGGMGMTSVISSAVVMAVFPVLMLVLMNTEGTKKACGVEKIFP